MAALALGSGRVSSKSPGILEPLRVRIRRFQFILGLGFLALVVGSVLSVSLSVRLLVRVQALEAEALRLLIVLVLENLWVLGVLPLVCYGAARILELRPLSTSLGAALSGEFFVLALDFVREGLDGLWQGAVASSLRLAAFATGVFLSYRAVARGRAAAEEGAARARAKAEARKGEYLEFLREAERGAEKSAQREAERAAVAASAGGATEAAAAQGGALVPTAELSVSAGTAEPPAPAEVASPPSAPSEATPSSPGEAGEAASGETKHSATGG